MRMLKWIGIGLAVLIGLVIAGVAVAYAVTSAQMGKTYKYGSESISISSDQETLALGKYLVEGLRCLQILFLGYPTKDLA